MKDQPAALRDEDAFDTRAVHGWLKSTVDGLDGTPTVKQYPGGASNLTYLLSYPDRELILRRPPTGHKAASAHDMRREYTVQKQLKPVYPYVPNVLALCTDLDVIGSDFYVMDRIDGIILRGDLPDDVTLSPDEASSLAYRVFDRLVELHEVDPEAAGLSGLGKGAGYVERQVRGWSDRFRKARTPDSPDGEEIMAWLHENQPGDVRTCVIHNDFRFDNVILDNDLDVVGVLDWEMATLGDPLMDLAGCLAYWIQADDDEIALSSRRQPSHLPGMPKRRELVAYYCDRMGLSAENWLFYDVFGAFRLAVIMQQIYYRFHSGQTHNPAFAHLETFVTYLFGRCEKKLR